MPQTMPDRTFRAPSGALLVSPDPDRLVTAEHRLLVDELLNTTPAGNSPGGPSSVAWVLIPPGQSTDAHVHPESWADVVVLSCGPEGALTQLGPDMDQVIVQFAWQILRIPPGLEHRAHNPSEHEWVIAYEFRNCPSVFDDRVIRHHLNSVPLPLYVRPQPPVFRTPAADRQHGTH